jgi:hypothetical protein
MGVTFCCGFVTPPAFALFRRAQSKPPKDTIRFGKVKFEPANGSASVEDHVCPGGQSTSERTCGLSKDENRIVVGQPNDSAISSFYAAAEFLEH